jgi:hypothetical protein
VSEKLYSLLLTEAEVRALSDWHASDDRNADMPPVASRLEHLTLAAEYLEMVTR